MAGKNNNEQIVEGKKATNSPAEIPDPVNVKAISPEDDASNAEASKINPKSKVGIINSTIENMKAIPADRLAQKYEAVMKALNEEDDVEDVDDEDEDESYLDEKKKKKFMKERKVTKEDVDLSDDVTAALRGEDLSEEFKEKATEIFEAAVVAKVNSILSEMTKEYDYEFAAIEESIIDSITSQVDSYTDYVVEEWLNENAVAIDSGIRLELAESFMTSLRNTFLEHYIDIPDDKVNVVDEMASSLDEANEELNEEREKNIALRKEIEGFKRAEIVSEVCSSLVETNASKIRSLAEGVDFDDEDTFRSRLMSIRESYFPYNESNDLNDIDPVALDEELDHSNSKNTDPRMTAYLDAIKRIAK
jgi:hypothetical protein